MSTATPRQSHRILRQVLELDRCEESDAQAIWQTLRQLHDQKLVPLMDRICSAQSDGGLVYRIERMEIDLGTVPIQSLESTLADSFEGAFARALTDSIRSADTLNADLELLEHFLSTGTVPWWADPNDASRLSATIAQLRVNAPRTLRDALHRALVTPLGLRRLVSTLPDVAWEAALHTLLPSPSGLAEEVYSPLTWGSALARMGPQEGLTAKAWARLWWEEALRLTRSGGDAPDRAWISRLLRAIAGRLCLSPTALLSRLVPFLRLVPSLSQSELAHELAGLRELLAVTPSTVPLTASAATPASGPELEQMLRDLTWEPEDLHSLSARLRTAVARLPAHLQPVVLGIFDAHRKRDAAHTPPHLTMAELLEQLRAHFAQPSAKRPAPAPQEVDSLYVSNAGLVLLWPFVENCFSRLQLLEGRQFRDPPARQRAIALLQYLASANDSPTEPLLPLNKLLCGIPPDANFEFDESLTETELLECDSLLSAAIAQAPVLNDISHAGFRGSFLLRLGQLSAQGEHWLLRVERVTYDIVLDRFPWSTRMIKLPWMPFVVQVEW